MQTLLKIASPFLIYILMLFSSLQLEAQKNLLTLIPAEATFITAVHSNSITQKVAWEELAKYQFVEEIARQASGALNPEDPDIIREALLNPGSYGVDLKANSYGFVELDLERGTFVTYLFPLNDVTKFKGLMEAYFGSNMNSLLQKQNDYLVIYKDNITIAWQKDHALISFAQINCDDYEETEEDYQARIKIEMVDYLVNTIGNTGSNSITTNEKFMKWEKTARDAGSWLNYTAIMRLMRENSYGGGYPGMFSSAIPILMELYGDMNLGSDISFEKGGIYSDNQIHLDEDMIELSVKAASRKANKRFLQYLDGENTIAYLMMSMSPQGVYDGWKELLMKKAGSIGKDVVKDFFGILEIFMDEKAAFNFIKGDAIVALNGIKVVKTTETDYIYNPDTEEYEPEDIEVERPMPIFTVAFSYGKKEDMMKFIRIFSTLGLLREGAKGVYEGGSNQESFDKFFVKLDKGMMIISNDEDRLVNGKKYKPMDKKHLDVISQNLQAVYFSPAKMIDAIKVADETLMPDDEIMMKEFKSLFGDMYIQTARPKSGDTFMKQTFMLEMKNKETNSLKLLLEFINKQYLDTMKGT